MPKPAQAGSLLYLLSFSYETHSPLVEVVPAIVGAIRPLKG